MDKSSGGKPLKEYWGDVKYTDVAKLDGEHLVQRTLEVGRLGGFWGIMWGTAHVVNSYPLSPLLWVTGMSSRIAYMALMGATFGGTTSFLGKHTGKDRYINYFLGGCAGGSLLGLRSHSIQIGSAGCLGMGSMTLFRKVAAENDWKIWPEEQEYWFTRPEDRHKFKRS